MRQQRRGDAPISVNSQKMRANRGHERSTGPTSALNAHRPAARSGAAVAKDQEPSMGQDARPIQRMRRWRWRWRWRWLLAVAACALVVIAVRHLLLHDGRPPQRAAEARQNGAPVHVAVVATRSFPVILNGLGTVQ